ncbi:MAG: sensor histidine kinase [Bacteroidetes bacterium]|nr:sensor histidine kinase [Bacteroidota bacterium]
MKYLRLGRWLLLTCCLLFGCTDTSVKSKQENDDHSMKVKDLFRGWELYQNQPDSAIRIARENMTKYADDSVFIAKNTVTVAAAQIFKNEYDSARASINSVNVSSFGTYTKSQIAMVKGLLDFHEEKFVSALLHYREYLKYRSKDESSQTMNQNLAQIYYYTGNKYKSLSISRDIYLFFKQFPDSTVFWNAALSYGSMLNQSDSFKKAEIVLHSHPEKIPFVYQLLFNSEKSICMAGLGQADSAIQLLTSNLDAVKNITYVDAVYHLNLAHVYLKLRKLDEAERSLLYVQKLPIINNATDLKKDFHLYSERLMLLNNNIDKADYHRSKLSRINDSFAHNLNNEFIQGFETKYQTEQKEQRIAFLEKEQELKNQQIKQKNRIAYGSAGGSGVILMLAGLAFYNQKQRQKAQKALQAAQKAEAEKTQKLELVTAQIAAQEQERERIARELHDGIAPNMAALKWSINDQLPNKQEAEKVYEQFERISNELRALSHGLSSPTNKPTSLSENLVNYLSAQENSGVQIELKLPANGLPILSESIEVAIYRTVQELTQNCIKHAKASTLTVEFKTENEQLEMFVADNGNGFSAEEQQMGIGLNNIKNRIEDLGGKFALSPNLGIGTSILIKLHLEGKT